MAVGVVVVLSFFRRPRPFYLEHKAQSKCQRTRQTVLWKALNEKCLFWSGVKATPNYTQQSRVYNTLLLVQRQSSVLHRYVQKTPLSVLRSEKGQDVKYWLGVWLYSHLHWWSGWSWLGRYGSLRGPLWTRLRRNTPPPPAQWDSSVKDETYSGLLISVWQFNNGKDK